MTSVRLRYVADVNPPSQRFDGLEGDDVVSFVPLECVWPRAFDASQLRSKATVASGYTRFESGDILVPKITPTFQADRTVIARDLHGGVAAGSTELHVVRPTMADRSYVRYLLSSHPFLDGGESQMIGVAGQKRVPEDWLRDLRVPVTDVYEQRRIGSFLDSETERIDQLVDAKERTRERCFELRSSVAFEAAAGLLLEPDCARNEGSIPWQSSAPAHWKSASLRLVAELGSGHTPSRSHPEWWVDCTVPWVTTGEVARLRSDRHEWIHDTREKISELGLANSSAVVHPAGTVVLCRTSASAGYSGIIAEDMATSQDFAAWTCGPALRPRFLLLCLRAMRRDLLERLGQGSTHVTIYMPDLASIRVPIPPVEEQDAIAEEAWRRMNLLSSAEDVLTEQVRLLRERRRSLITAAVTGEIEVP